MIRFEPRTVSFAIRRYATEQHFQTSVNKKVLLFYETEYLYSICFLCSLYMRLSGPARDCGSGDSRFNSYHDHFLFSVLLKIIHTCALALLVLWPIVDNSEFDCVSRKQERQQAMPFKI